MPMAPTPRMRQHYSPELISEALMAVEGGQSIRSVAKAFGIPYGTLGDKLRGRRPVHYKERTAISSQDERKLVNWIVECARRGFGRSRAQVIDAVKKVVQSTGAEVIFKDGTPGRRWLDNFLSRHKDELSQRKPQGLGAERAGVSEDKIRSWFRRAEEEIKAVDPTVLDDPTRIFNADETGFPLCVRTGTIIAPKEDRFVYQITSDTKHQVTVLVCGAADGTLLKPLIIFPGVRFSYNPVEGFEDAHFARSPNGWIDTHIFEKWMGSVFIPSVAHLPKPVLLLVDGHKTHLTLNIHELCVENNIIMYAFTPHASHVQQPLDQMPLKNLKQSWRKQVQIFQETAHQTVGKQQFARVLKQAWDEGIKSDVLKAAFRITGLYPWSPDSVNYKKCRTSALFDSRPTPQPSGQPGLASATQTLSTTTALSPDTPPTTDPLQTISADTPTTDPLQTISADTPTTDPLQTISADTPATTDPLQTLSPDTPVTTDPLQTLSPDTSSTHLAVASEGSGLCSSKASSSTSLPPIESQKAYLDRLIDLSISLGMDKVNKFRGCLEKERTDPDPNFASYFYLYNKVLSHSSPAPSLSFDNLPLPQGWGKKTQRIHIQPPKMVSSQEFKQFRENQEEKKRRETAEKEERKRLKETKKIQRQQEMERKKENMERKKQERQKKKEEKEKKKQEKEEKKNQEKEEKKRQKEKKTTQKRKAEDSISSTSTPCSSTLSLHDDSASDFDLHHASESDDMMREDEEKDLMETETTEMVCEEVVAEEEEVIEGQNQMDEKKKEDIDVDVCYGCKGRDSDKRWVGCECGRWFHVKCAGDERFQLMSLGEIEREVFKCSYCAVGDC